MGADGSLPGMTPDEKNLTTKLGLRLREARKAQNLSLGALANMTGDLLSKSRISNYEQGLRRLGIDEARLLSKALGTVTATYLLCLDNEGLLETKEQWLLEFFRKMDDRGRDTVLALARSQYGATEK